MAILLQKGPILKKMARRNESFPKYENGRSVDVKRPFADRLPKCSVLVKIVKMAVPLQRGSDF